MSISFVTILKPAGPNQFGRCAGSAHAENTTSRRAPITRDSTISRSSAHWSSALLADEVIVNSLDRDWYVAIASRFVEIVVTASGVRGHADQPLRLFLRGFLASSFLASSFFT